MDTTVENLSHSAVNEAYILLSSYLREEKIAANYSKEYLTEFVQFLHDVLKNPHNFVLSIDDSKESDE